MVYYTSSAVRDSLLIRVSARPQPLTLSASAAALQVGSSLQVLASVSVPLQWRSDNVGVATVSGSGLVTGVSAGTVVVTATDASGVGASITLTVNAAVQGPLGPLPSTAELPRVTLDPAISAAAIAVITRSIAVSSSSAFQAALDTARYGDEIVLAAGVTYTGSFVLKAKTGSGWITIRGSGSTVGPNVRVTPSSAAGFPRLVGAYSFEPALATAPGARNYRIVGVEVTAASAWSTAGALVSLGAPSGSQANPAVQVSNIVLDRVYIHGTPTLDFRRCILLNSAATAIINSWISDCHGRGADSQAIVGWNGSGPYKIVNNYLEGAGENIMFGGADPADSGVVPSDIEIRRNHFYKPLAWQGVWLVKNLLELKIGRRVLIEGNVLENNWGDGQIGFGVLFKSTNQDGTAPWSETSNVTFRFNVLRNSAHGINLAGAPEPYPVVPMSRVYVGHNSLEQIGTGPGRFEGGRVFQLGAGMTDATIEFNSGVGPLNGFLLYGAPMQRLAIRNNVVTLTATRFGGWGQSITSADGLGFGKGALDAHAPGSYTFVRNLIPAASSSWLPTDNIGPTTVAEIGFTAFPSNLELTNQSSYRTSATDGTPVGVNFSLLRQMTSGVIVQP
jgi:hypothetical protein